MGMSSVSERLPISTRASAVIPTCILPDETLMEATSKAGTAGVRERGGYQQEFEERESTHDSS